jgi:hypothetical protein
MKPAAPEITAEWRSFEQAVAAILQALDPNARVTHDAHTPDLDTGLPRQRDVWIELPVFGGQALVKFLVSCKRKKARLSQQDIDAFWGELNRSGAQVGILYSHGGFSKPALAKAARLGISCCGLFEDRPADLPGVLVFNAYCFRERVKIDVQGASLAELGQLLDAPLDADGEGLTVLGRLIADYEAQRISTMAGEARGLRPDWTSALSLQVGAEAVITIKLSSGWSAYRAKPEAWLLNGSYSFTGKTFAGALSTPFVDQHSNHPGPGWDPIEGDEIDEVTPRVLIYSHGGEFASGLRALVAESAAA